MARVRRWRYAIGLGAIPAVIVLVLRFFYTSESPMWSAAHDGWTMQRQEQGQARGVGYCYFKRPRTV